MLIINGASIHLDFGIDTLLERVEKTNFPWLMSNVIDNETGQPLADGKVTHIVDWCGRKIGLVNEPNSVRPKQIKTSSKARKGS